MNLQLGPLGYKGESGIKELQNLLQVSQPTEAHSIRQVVVPVPPGWREEMVNELPGITAIMEFFLIATSRNSLPPPSEQLDLSGEGQKGELPGGGILHLRVYHSQSPATATLDVTGCQIFGYEQVRQIRFVLPADPTPPPVQRPELERRIPPRPLPPPPQLDQVFSLTETEFQAKAEPALSRIFISNDPFYPQPFAADVPARRILNGLHYAVEPPLLDAVITAAQSIGDRGFYFTSLWRGSPDLLYDWYIPFTEISAYKGPNSPIEQTILSKQVIFSPQGKWGIMTTHERHALLGSSQMFMDELCKLVPDLDNQVNAFLEDWQYHKAQNYGAITDWIPGQLTQTYGSETAEKMLREVGLP